MADTCDGFGVPLYVMDGCHPDQPLSKGLEKKVPLGECNRGGP